MPTLTENGASIAYTDTGTPPGRPDAATVVFGHGLLFSGRMFSAQVAALRDTYRCVCIDWRGQGDSPPADGGYDMDALTGDTIALIEHLGAAPVHYVGLSMGGFVGMRLAARRPELIGRLVLLDTSAEEEDPAAARKDRLMASIFRSFGIAPVRKGAMKIMFGAGFLADARSGPIVDEWTAALSRCDRGAIRRAVLAVADRPSILGEISAIAAPTLVVVGEHDVATPPDRSRTIVGSIPGSRLEIVADCGHSSTVEQPEALTTLITDFLAEPGVRSP